MSLDTSSRAALLERTPGVFPVDHPLVQHKISSLRRAETQPREFRSLVEELGTLVAYEATRDLQLETVPIETPLETGVSRAGGQEPVYRIHHARREWSAGGGAEARA